MPRSKRKAAQAKVAARPDFLKKKQKLGSRRRADNATNTSFTARHVYVPHQGRTPTPNHAAKPGLTLPELLQRTHHYNANTRLAAFNGLLRALCDSRAAAHAQAAVHIGRVLGRGLDALADDVGLIRASGGEVVVAAVGALPTVGPFMPVIAAQTLAALSHIRTDVRLCAARMLPRLLRVPGVSPSSIFGAGMANPLEALGVLLGAVSKMTGRAAVLEAVTVLCDDCTEGGVMPHMTPRRKRSGMDAGPRPFYYHRPRSLKRRSGEDSDVTPVLVARLSSAESASKLLAQAVYIATECLHAGDDGRSSTRLTLLTWAARAIHGLACPRTLSCKVTKGALHRLIREWAEGSRGVDSAGDVGLSMAEAALAGGEVDAVQNYLLRALGGKGVATGSELDKLVARFLDRCEDIEQRRAVGDAWARRCVAAADAGDADCVARAAGDGILAKVMWSGLHERDQGFLKLAVALPRMFAMVVAARVGLGGAGAEKEEDDKGEKEKEREAEMMERLRLLQRGEEEVAKQAALVTRREATGDKAREQVGEAVAQHLPAASMLAKMGADTARDLAAAAYYGGSVLHVLVVRRMVEVSGMPGGEEVCAAFAAAVAAGVCEARADDEWGGENEWERRRRRQVLDGLAALEVVS